GTNWSGFVSAGYTQLGTAVGSFGTSSYGVSGVLTLNLTPMDSVMFEGSWGDPPFNGAGGVSTSGPPGNGGFGFNNGWAAFGSLRHYFSKTFRTDWDFSYGKQSGPSALQQNITAIGGDLVWLPYTGFRAKVGATWTKTGSASGVWAAQVALRRDW
ncbi:MAG TPA: hypothetical protein VG894_07650, partial [Bauldia sp.]|nr:hypothetical protein [Bauldia sp.]